MDYLKVANSFPMWLAAGLAISLALFQAIIFAKKSYSTGKEIGLTEEQMKSAIKSSFITSLGPSFVILTGLLSLLVTVGGPMAWMRLSFIGSVMFEMMAAGFGTEAVGVKMGIDPMTNIAFANAVWTMILGSLGWIVFSTLTADKMEKVQTKFSKGDKGLLSIISITAMLGSFGSLVSGHLMAMNKNTIAALAGGAIMLILSPISEKKNIKWLKE
ncbi:MAG TPA: DUF5058 domain-containing protein, partial [Tissierella sp.]